MKIVMMTNTFFPIMGGLERSVMAFAQAYRKLGHKVLIVTPSVKKETKDPYGVIRLPSIQYFTGADFSVKLPIPRLLTKTLNLFQPDIVHAHHPFLIGDTALRVSKKYNIPLVFTHHTLFEEYLQYVPVGADLLKRFVVELSTRYANFCHHVFAPSESVRNLLKARGVKTPISIVPTGIPVKQFARGDGKGLRRLLKIPPHAFVVGHVGRLAPEKNLEFLAHSVALFLKKQKNAHFFVVGKGPSEEAIWEIFQKAGVLERLHMPGLMRGKKLVNAYHAMDIFAFASQSETQGLVLIEAMAGGTPVIAVDAPGVREVVKNKINGRLLRKENAKNFSKALEWYESLPHAQKRKIRNAAKKMAGNFSMAPRAERALAIYRKLLLKEFVAGTSEGNAWKQILRQIKIEFRMIFGLTKATTAAVVKSDEDLKIKEQESGVL